MSRAGAHFGHYRLDRKIGSGGMGQVWKAYDTDSERDVALKLIRSDLVDDERYRARFEREARTVARLRAPGIVPIHGVGEIGGRFYIDMALVDGVDLTEMLHRAGRLDPERAVEVVAQVADALDAAHQAGVVHRDVKPSNIVVDVTGGVYLIDFGIAHADGQTHVTEAVGTVAYLAPERLTGEGGAPADVYSLACVLYECLTGSRPFPMSSRFEQMRAHRETPPPRPSEHGAPARFDAVIARGMAKKPKDRYPSAGALAAAARAALSPRRPRWPWGVGAAAAAGVAATATFFAVRGPSITTVAIGADGSDVAIDAKANRAVVTHLSSDIITVVDTKTHEIAGTLSVGFSPTSIDIDAESHWAYVASEGNRWVSVVDIETSTTIGTVDVGRNPVDLTLDPTSDSAYVANFDDGTVSVIDTKELRVRSTIDVGTGPQCVAVDSQASRAYVTNTGDGTVSVVDLSRDEVVTTIDVAQSAWCVAVDPKQRTGFVTNVDDREVLVIDLKKNEVVSEIRVESSPRGIEVQGRRAFVAGEIVTVIDTLTNVVVETMDLGTLPTSLAVDGGKVYAVTREGLEIFRP